MSGLISALRMGVCVMCTSSQRIRKFSQVLVCVALVALQLAAAATNIHTSAAAPFQRHSFSLLVGRRVAVAVHAAAEIARGF